MPLDLLEHHPSSQMLILFVKRGGDTTKPHGNTRLYEDVSACGASVASHDHRSGKIRARAEVLS